MKTRKRFGKYPVPAQRADLYWSKQQPELANISDGHLTALIMGSPAFKEILLPKLEAIDERNKTIAKGKQMGRPLRWRAVQLESVFLYRRFAGTETLKEAWARLHSEPESRLLLGLGEQLPSRATLCRYIRQHFDENEREEKYLQLDERLRQEVMRLPGFDQEARILGMDGSKHGTHFTPPIRTSKSQRKREEADGKEPRKIANAHIVKGKPGAITAPTAGFIGRDGGPKAGQGWQLIGLWTEHGTLLGWDISPLNKNEGRAAKRVLASYQDQVLPHRDREALSVLSADAGFNSNEIRKHAQVIGLVPNIPKASHKEVPGLPETKTENAVKRNKSWHSFKFPENPDYENWGANGHGEISCQCGQGKSKRADTVSANDHLTLAVKGHCSTCGNITITAGKWRWEHKVQHWVRCYRDDDGDFALGNSLTFNDPLAKTYGQDRFGWGESVHATLRKRFGLLKDKSWMRDITEVRTEFAIAASAISILLLERQAKQAATKNTARPPAIAA